MFERVVIIGVGLLGGSLARDLRAYKLAKTVIGVCRSAATKEFSLEHKVVDEVLPLQEALFGADLVVLATPMQAMLPVLNEVSKFISENTILTDVGSVKTDLYARIKAEQPQLLEQFVLAHPIAGAESSGVSASRLGLFSGKNVIITPTEEVAASSVQRVSSLWESLSARVLRMSLTQHDAIFAKTSHLPHVVAFTLVNYLDEQANRDELFDLAAAGFYDFTRIASSDAEMWRDICVTNRQEVLSALDGLSAQINEIRGRIENVDQEGILGYFDTAKAARNKGLENKEAAQKDE